MRNVLLALLCAASIAHAADPIVRVQVEGKPPYLVGQQVRVVVDVFVPNYFMSGVEIPTMTIPGAVVSMPDESAQHLTETIAGREYAGIRRSFVVVPQREGEFTLPPARLAFRYAAEPGKPTPGSVTLPPLKLAAVLPAGARAAGGGSAVPVARVTVKQSLDRDPKGLKAGDALTRTVEVYAERTQAMMIPPPKFEAPDGVRVYPQDPVLTDVTDARAAFLGGRRVDRVIYVFEKPGEYALPEIDVGWFNAAADRREAAVAPAVTLSVAPNPDQKPDIAPETPDETAAPAAPLPWKRGLGWASAAALAFGVLFALVRFAAPKLRAWGAARRKAYEKSEPAYAARVLAACAANRPREAYADFIAWARRGDALPVTPSLRDEVARLEVALYSGRADGAPWSGATLAAAFTAARKSAPRSHVPDTSLPALNP